MAASFVFKKAEPFPEHCIRSVSHSIMKKKIGFPQDYMIWLRMRIPLAK